MEPCLYHKNSFMWYSHEIKNGYWFAYLKYCDSSPYHKVNQINMDESLHDDDDLDINKVKVEVIDVLAHGESSR